jgi:hypothetical protein
LDKEKILGVAERINAEIPDDVVARIRTAEERNLEDEFAGEVGQLLDSQYIDLMWKGLMVDFEERHSAQELLQQPFVLCPDDKDSSHR